jgi:DMSO/TMAO reductase YedYZ molybdopterin-dependent catalytic subunit
MLTYAWDGVPLLMEHGFPLRIYIPNVMSFDKQVR